MTRKLIYAGVALDRVAVARRDDAWIAERLADPKARIVPVWRDLNLFAAGDGADGVPGAVLLAAAEAGPVLAAAAELAILGLENSTAYFAADLSGLDEAAAGRLADGGEFRDLRQVGALMRGPEAALLAYARGLMYWHRRHRFCGVCGEPTASQCGGHVRRCGNAQEPHEHFPRTDPAVIMLVTADDLDGRGPAALLGRQSRWPDGMYSTLAGFVEPGETLEEAVAREVREETSVTVADVRYQASQPWPFPSSLMLGFRARAVTTGIEVDKRELQDAKWFRPEDIRRFGEWGTAPPGANRLPRKDSIARWLIETWLAERGA